MDHLADPPSKKPRTQERSGLDQLKDYTVIVADTGDFSSIKKYSPQDATTNPSLILKAAQIEAYKHLIDEAVSYAKSKAEKDEEVLELALDKVAVNFGAEIAKIVPGYISTEVDARLSFDTEATIKRARRIIALYEEMGVDRSRILIKIASTFEGIRAGQQLESEGIRCNLTLLFSLIQAAACAESGITLISPFVGRILDWFKAKTGKTYTSEDDPGVLSVRKIFQYFKKFGYNTIVMGASFRNIGEVLALAGCDRLTIAPSLLEELSAYHETIVKHLDSQTAGQEYAEDRLDVSEPAFRFALNEDAMATEKLSEGIRLFVADIIKLEDIIKTRM
jgi:transaldolase